jgi:hypothetical protein
LFNLSKKFTTGIIEIVIFSCCSIELESYTGFFFPTAYRIIRHMPRAVSWTVEE